MTSLAEQRRAANREKIDVLADEIATMVDSDLNSKVHPLSAKANRTALAARVVIYNEMEPAEALDKHASFLSSSLLTVRKNGAADTC